MFFWGWKCRPILTPFVYILDPVSSPHCSLIETLDGFTHLPV